VGNATAITRKEVASSPSSSMTYNAHGDAVVNKDTAGNYSYKSYDAKGRVRYEIDAERNVTEHVYDSFGQETSVKRYAAPIDLTGLSPTQEIAPDVVANKLSQQGISTNADNRTIQKQYDNLGHLRWVFEPSVFYYDATTGNSYTYIRTQVTL